jgi:transcriptional regulator with XRE-family HTH domain
MSDTTRIPKIERTPEQKAEERRIREMHRQNPIREVPTDTITGADVVILYRFVAAIRREREALGLTPDDVAKRAGIEPSAYIRLEAGNSIDPSLSSLFRIARALGKSLNVELVCDPSEPESGDEEDRKKAAVLRASMNLASKVSAENPYGDEPQREAAGATLPPTTS